MSLSQTIRISTAGGLLMLVLPAAAELRFSPADIMEWDPHSFKGKTRYSLVEIDASEAVHAVCDQQSASGLFYREDIDLTETPVLEWSWRVEATYTGIDETTQAGDDYPARLYVVDESPVLRWRTRALNYVWASEKERGSDWPNAYAHQAHMIAVRDRDDVGTGWHTERRNVLEDFQRYHDYQPDRINAVAIMTDCDDTGETAEAWYGTIRFVAE